MNPWLSIWTQPRATISTIVSTNPNRSLWFLSAIYGFCSLLNLFQTMALGNSLTTMAIFLLAFLLSPFWGYLLFAIWSGVVTGVGRLLKGQGSFKAIRAAYAWSCVPIILNIPLWLLMVALFGHQLFQNLPNSELLSQSLIAALFTILIAKVVLAIWSLVIYLNALAEVQQFSVLRAIGNVILAGVVLSLIFYLLWMLLAVSVKPATFLFDGITFLQTLRSYE